MKIKNLILITLVFSLFLLTSKGFMEEKKVKVDKGPNFNELIGSKFNVVLKKLGTPFGLNIFKSKKFEWITFAYKYGNEKVYDVEVFISSYKYNNVVDGIRIYREYPYEIYKGIKIGTTEKEVKKILGEPDSISTKNDITTLTWKKLGLYIYTKNGKVDGVFFLMPG